MVRKLFAQNCLSKLLLFLLPGKMLPTKSTITTKEEDVELTQITDTYYESTPDHYNPTKIVTTDSKGDVLETVIRYPFEENNKLISLLEK